MTKKQVIRNFGRENGIFFLKKPHSEILVCETFSLPPKLGARSPPMDNRVPAKLSIQRNYTLFH